MQGVKLGKYHLAVATALATFLVYLPALHNQFVNWDDDRYIFENPHIRSFGAEFFRWAFLEFYASNWHPLTRVSHAVDYAIWGLNPLGHHLTSVLLHAVNTGLVVVLVLIARDGEGGDATGSAPPLPERSNGPDRRWCDGPPVRSLSAVSGVCDLSRRPEGPYLDQTLEHWDGIKS